LKFKKEVAVNGEDWSGLWEDIDDSVSQCGQKKVIACLIVPGN